MRVFYPGDTLFVRNVRNKTLAWLQGIIVSQTGPLSYKIKLESSGFWVPVAQWQEQVVSLSPSWSQIFLESIFTWLLLYHEIRQVPLVLRVYLQLYTEKSIGFSYCYPHKSLNSPKYSWGRICPPSQWSCSESSVGSTLILWRCPTQSPQKLTMLPGIHRSHISQMQTSRHPHMVAPILKCLRSSTSKKFPETITDMMLTQFSLFAHITITRTQCRGDMMRPSET